MSWGTRIAASRSSCLGGHESRLRRSSCPLLGVPFGFTWGADPFFCPPPKPLGESRPPMQKITRALPALAVLCLPIAAFADEAKLILPDLGSVSFLGFSGRNLLLAGLVVCALGLL